METLQRTANRGSISTGSYEIDNSVKLEPDNSEYFQRPASGSNGSLTTWTFSLWLKRTELSHNNIFYSQGGNGRVRFESNDTFSFRYKSGNEFTTSRVFRDTSAWYHIVIAVDTTQATASDRVKIYFNGVQETMSGTQPALNATSDFGAFSTVTAQLGQFTEGAYYFAGYMAEFYWIDGIQQAPTAFGEFDEDSGIWKPKAYTGSFGSEGVYLDFSNSANLGDDVSGNGNDYTPNNITSIDQATDTPTNNFCTINALVDNGFAIWSLTEGGTRGPNTGEGNTSVGSFAVSKGKWYWEGVTTAATGLNYWKWGITRVDMQQGYSGDPGTGSAWYSAEDTFLTQTGVASESPAYDTGITSYTIGDIWSISLNCDVNPYEITLRFNNSVPGTAANNTDRSVGTFASADAVMPYFFLMNSSSDNTWHNFGNPFIATLSGGNTDENGYGDFKYAPPSGYYALCSKNLAEFG